MLTKFVDLVARPGQQAQTESGETIPQGYTSWKGKLVKNFKKFKKVKLSGFELIYGYSIIFSKGEVQLNTCTFICIHCTL